MGKRARQQSGSSSSSSYHSSTSSSGIDSYEDDYINEYSYSHSTEDDDSDLAECEDLPLVLKLAKQGLNEKHRPQDLQLTQNQLCYLNGGWEMELIRLAGMVEFFKTIKVVPKLMSDCSGCECAFWTLEKVMPKSKLVSSCDNALGPLKFNLGNLEPTRLFADISNRDSDELGGLAKSINTYAAGFPCQPFSMLHNHSRFLKETAARIFFWVMASVARCLPKIAFLENVCGILRIWPKVWRILRRHLMFPDHHPEVQRDIAARSVRPERGRPMDWDLISKPNFRYPRWPKEHWQTMKENKVDPLKVKTLMYSSSDESVTSLRQRHALALIRSCGRTRGFTNLSQSFGRMGYSPWVPCLTPKGEFFHLSSGRYLTATEKMLFQSVPLDKLDVSFLSDKEVETLAGNAMSVRAATAAWVAAFSAVSAERWDAESN